MTPAPSHAGRDFHHPYEPYNIQLDFMNAVFDCIDHGRVGIFESPTGTGKSLSLICGSLAWLRSHKRQQLSSDLAVTHYDDDEPDWLHEAERKQKQALILRQRSDLSAKLAKIRATEDKARRHYDSGEPLSKRQKRSDASDTTLPGEETFLLDEYHSDDESRAHSKDDRGLSVETLALLQQLDPASYKEDSADLDDALKIFFCSRTHSQLSQFINELRRTEFSSSSASSETSQPQSLETDTESIVREAVKQLSLGSRKNFCINSKVSKLSSATAINERCLELQQSSTPVDARCTFLPIRDKQELINDFRDHALAKVRDIEDLGKIGKKLGVCPYYASRAAIRPSELITLPYPLLLQRTAREALGISLKGHVVIIDEAHNLMDSITNIYTVSITLDQFRRARSQLLGYLQKFKNKLKGSNRVYVAQVVRLLDSLTATLDTACNSSLKEGQTNANALMSGKGVDQINLFKLIQYLRESKLARKVDGYTDFEKQQMSKKEMRASKDHKQDFPIMTYVQDFLMVLTHPDPEGRYFWTRLDSTVDGLANAQLKYMLLDPTPHFKEIVDEARAVILAGGTMSPIDEYTHHLFSYVDPTRIQTLSCDHVIPPSNLVALPIASGSNSGTFEFTFEKRRSESAIQELGETILKLAGAIPDGVVIFFPSYAYLETAQEVWRKSSAVGNLWDQLQQSKPLFQEPSSRSIATKDEGTLKRHAKVDEVLAEYSSTIHDPANEKGALLFAVIGGSLSEGINFSDRLGRGIIVVGLPFPNSQSPEWKAKLAYVQQRAGTTSSARNAAARELSTNTCMRAVNQSIGRAIRHKNDYAAIVLLDKRYGRDDIKAKLPAWIQKSLQSSSADFAGHLGSLRRFFTSKMNA